MPTMRVNCRHPAAVIAAEASSTKSLAELTRAVVGVHAMHALRTA
jgi:hypothetical protein